MIGQELGKTTNTTPTNLADGYRLTELGPLPEAWRVMKLGRWEKIITGKTPPISKIE